MDLKTATAIRRLRLVSAPEAISFLLLLVCSVLKRTTDFNAVPVMGAVHGMLYFVLSVLPTGGFFAERKLRRETEDAVIASRARKEGVVGA